MIPVSVITGFLGSGKTSLLRRLLADPQMGETAVLVNEFGEVGLDHLLVRKVDENIVLLNSGCLCCTVRDDLVETLDDLWAKRVRGDLTPFARVAIETTGLADPAPIIQTLMTDESLSPHYWLTNLITTVDATHADRQLDEHVEALKQAAMADHLVITKSDLSDARPRAALCGRLTAINPSAHQFESTLETGPGAAELLAIEAFTASNKSNDVRNWLNAEAYSAAKDAHGVHSHDPGRHDNRIGAFCFVLDSPLDWTRFQEWLSLLLAARGEQILRIKGILNVAGRTKPVILHGVQHIVYPPSQLPEWPDDDRRSRLVFITKDLSRTAVENALRRILN